MSSTLPPNTDATSPEPWEGVPVGGASARVEDSGSGNPDQSLVEQTRQQIKQLAAEIGQLSQSDVGLDEFYEGFASRVIVALAGQGAAVWSTESQGRLSLSYQADLPRSLAEAESADLARHHALLSRVIQRGEAMLVPPRSGAQEEDEAGNPTEFLLVLAPLKVGGETLGLIEVFQRPGSGPATQRGYLRFLVQMAEQAGGFLKNHQLRELSDRQQLMEHLDRLMGEVHRDLDLGKTVAAIVNEGRQVAGVDRIALALPRRGRWHIESVSGLDSVERRSNEIKWLDRLVETVCRSGRELWYDGNDRDLPPQIEEPLHEYLDQSHTKHLAVIPLIPGTDDEDTDKEAASQQRPIGCLVIEQIAEVQETRRLRGRVRAIARHSTLALANARRWNDLPFVNTLHRMGHSLRWLEARNLPTTLLVVAALVATIATLVVVPLPYQLTAEGQLVPVNRQDVFAPYDGVVSQLSVNDQPNQWIDQGAPLLELTNETLLDEINQLEGTIRQLEQRINSIERDLVDNYADLKPIEHEQLSSEQEEAKTRIAATRASLRLKREQLAQLKVQSPIAGELVDWQISQKLYRRRVSSGQVLLSLVDPTGPWKIDLALPEHRLGHLQEAMEETGQPVDVTFVLASLPGKTFHGTIEWVDQFAAVDPSVGNTVLVQVAIDREDIPEEVRVSGARVRAKIECGTRSAGYVLFNDVWETFESRVLFWVW